MRIAKGFNFWSVTITLIAWFVIVLAISFTHFYASMNEHTEEHASTSLHDVSTGIAKIMETKIEGQWATLAPVARYAGEEEDMLNQEILIRINGRHERHYGAFRDFSLQMNRAIPSITQVST